MGRLEGKVALISGAARGQGADEARLFAAEGASVVLGDITDQQGQQVASEIEQEGGSATYLHLDVTRESDWKNAVSMAVTKYSKLDILVNNAGILLLKGLEETKTSEWDAVQDVNSRGVFLGAKTVVPAMRAAGGGSIVNISSIAGLSGSGSPAYSSSKGLVRILSKSIAVEYGPERIRCNSVHPGVIDTEMVNGLIGTGDGRQSMINKTPLGIIATARDGSLGVLYLASDESRYVTGSELVIDGGITVNR